MAEKARGPGSSPHARARSSWEILAAAGSSVQHRQPKSTARCQAAGRGTGALKKSQLAAPIPSFPSIFVPKIRKPWILGGIPTISSDSVRDEGLILGEGFGLGFPAVRAGVVLRLLFGAGAVLWGQGVLGMLCTS